MAAANLRHFPITPDENKYDATEILEQSFLPRFDVGDDYLDLTLQFGYINMFTVVWGLLPIAAAGKQIFEFKADVHKLLYATKRSLPLATSSTIGEYQNTLYLTSLFAIIVVSGMIAMSTGALDYWMMGFYPDAPECSVQDLVALELMRPELDREECVTWTLRISVMIAIEHVAIALLLLVVLHLSPVPPEVLEAVDDSKKRVKRRRTSVQSNLAPHVADAIRPAFNHYDADLDGCLRKKEVLALVKALCGSYMPYSSDDTDMLLMYMGKPHSGKYTFDNIMHGINLAQGDKLLVQVFPADLMVENARRFHRPRKVQSLGASEPRRRSVKRLGGF